MLKGIPSLLSPELLKILSEMGHSDRIVIADGNFPAETMGKDAIVIRYDGNGVPEVLDAILSVIPLDSYVEKPVLLMNKAECDKDMDIPIWNTYADIVTKHETRGADVIGGLDRFDFYDEAKKCYAIVATGETSVYANIILQKGVVKN